MRPALSRGFDIVFTAIAGIVAPYMLYVMLERINVLGTPTLDYRGEATASLFGVAVAMALTRWGIGMAILAGIIAGILFLGLAIDRLFRAPKKTRTR